MSELHEERLVRKETERRANIEVLKHPKGKPGDKNGKVTVLKASGDIILERGIRYATWLVRCECGETFLVLDEMVERIWSCGCMSKRAADYIVVKDIPCITEGCGHRYDRHTKVYGCREAGCECDRYTNEMTKK